MRYVWVDSGNDPDKATLHKHEINGVFFDIDDPRVTREYLAAQRNEFGRAGVYAAWNWPQYAGLTGAEFAEAVHERLKQIEQGSKLAPWHPKVQFNNELHSPQHIQDMLVRWRQLRRYRDTSWTPEGMQGGWMSPNLVDVINSRRIRVVPQCYTGDMEDMGVSQVVLDLTTRGIKAVSPFIDAASIQAPTAPWGTNSYYFTMGRLPRG